MAGDTRGDRFRRERIPAGNKTWHHVRDALLDVTLAKFNTIKKAEAFRKYLADYKEPCECDLDAWSACDPCLARYDRPAVRKPGQRRKPGQQSPGAPAW